MQKQDSGIENNTKVFNFRSAVRYILILIPLGVIANIVFSYLKTDRSIFRSIGTFSFEYLALAVVLGIAPWLTNTVRMSLWTRLLGKKVSPLEMFKIVLGTELAAAVSPTAVGGGYVKLTMLTQIGLTWGAAASIVTLLTFEDLVFFAIAIPISAVATSTLKLHVFSTLINRLPNLTHLWLLALIVILILGLSAVVLKKTNCFGKLSRGAPRSGISSKMRRFWSDFVSTYRLIGRRGRLLFALNVVLTAIQWACRYSVITALLACLNVPVQPVKFFLLQWVVFTVMTFTPTPGGSIGAEASFYLLFQQAIPANVLGLATAGWRFMTYYFQLSLGTVLFSPIHFRSFLPKGIGPSFKRTHKLSIPS